VKGSFHVLQKIRRQRKGRKTESEAIIITQRGGPLDGGGEKDRRKLSDEGRRRKVLSQRRGEQSGFSLAKLEGG